MKKFDYSLAQKRVKLLNEVMKLGCTSIKFITQLVLLLALLGVAFNYFSRRKKHAFIPLMGQQI